MDPSPSTLNEIINNQRDDGSFKVYEVIKSMELYVPKIDQAELLMELLRRWGNPVTLRTLYTIVIMATLEIKFPSYQHHWKDAHSRASKYVANDRFLVELAKVWLSNPTALVSPAEQ